MSKAKFGTAAANIPHSAFRTPHSEIDTQPPFSDTWAPTEPIDRCSTCCLLPVPNGGYRNFYGCWRDVQRGWAFPLVPTPYEADFGESASLLFITLTLH